MQIGIEVIVYFAFFVVLRFFMAWEWFLRALLVLRIDDMKNMCAV